MERSSQILYCELEYQEADASTGRNRVTLVCPTTRLIKRRSGLEIVSETPPLRKALRLQNDRYEVYFRFLHDGKAAFIRRDATRTYQFNLRHATPAQLTDLVRFSIRLSATPKSPVELLAAQPIGSKGTACSPTVRRPLRDRSNFGSEATSAAVTSAHKRRRVADAAPPSTASRVEQAPSLTADQRRVVDRIAAQSNVFFTGSAGTGKSFLLQQILAPHGPLRAYLRTKRVFATATTGIAAYNIGGMTLHHFAGLDTRVAASDVRQMAATIQCNKDALVRWRGVDVLVIDEVSMLDGRLFDALEALARELRPSHGHEFFGGIQLVLSGDFFQLPPVADTRSHATTLCFESLAWQRGVREIVELTQVFRQTNAAFVALLNAFRVGQPTRAMVETLNERVAVNALAAADDDDAIRIFTHNCEVQETNDKRLDQLAGCKYHYVSADTGHSAYLSSCPALPTLSLKRNAHVMLIKTTDALAGLVNGCRGVVVGFTPQTQLPIVRFENGLQEIVRHQDFSVRVADRVLACRRQLPLALAWAISIHKSQGLSFATAVLDLSRVFEVGQAYVALSRVRSLQGLVLRKRLDPQRLVLADKRVLRFYEEIRT